MYGDHCDNGIIRFLLVIIISFAIGIYYDWRTYGGSGADLIPYDARSDLGQADCVMALEVR